MEHCRKTEEELRESRELYRSIFDASPCPLAILQDGQYQLVSPSFLEVFGYTQEGVDRGLSFMDVVQGRDKESVLRRHEDHVAGKDLPRTYQIDLVTADGRAIPFETSEALISFGGRPANLVLTRDLTERLKAAEELSRQTEKLELALDASGIALWDYDVTTNRVTPCATLAAMYGHTVDEVEWDGAWWGRRTHQGDLADADSLWAEHADGRTPFFEYEYRGRTKSDEWRWFRSRCRIMARDEAGNPTRILGTVMDISRHRLADEQRRALQAETRKLEALGLLAGGVARDFGKIARSILNHAAIAASHVQSGSQAQARIEDVEASAVKATELAEQLLLCSGQRLLTARSLDLSRRAEDVAELLRDLIPRRAELRCDFAQALPPVYGDPAQLDRVLMNLIMNAAEAMGDDGGTIAVSTEFVPEGALDEAELPPDHIPGPHVCVRVADTGCGMDDATRERLFDPFFTTKSNRRGLGLGIVLGVVRGHRGFLRVASAPGEGTTIEVLLPCSAVAVDETADSEDA